MSTPYPEPFDAKQLPRALPRVSVEKNRFVQEDKRVIVSARAEATTARHRIALS